MHASSWQYGFRFANVVVGRDGFQTLSITRHGALATTLCALLSEIDADRDQQFHEGHGFVELPSLTSNAVGDHRGERDATMHTSFKKLVSHSIGKWTQAERFASSAVILPAIISHPNGAHIRLRHGIIVSILRVPTSAGVGQVDHIDTVLLSRD